MKTDRKRGLVWSLVRELARRKSQFTAKNLTPALTIEQANNALSELRQRGELKKVRQGFKGPGGFTATYQKTDQLRDPDLTGKWLEHKSPRPIPIKFRNHRGKDYWKRCDWTLNNAQLARDHHTDMTVIRYWREKFNAGESPFKYKHLGNKIVFDTSVKRCMVMM